LQKLHAGPYKKKKFDDIETDPLFGKSNFFDGVKETTISKEKDQENPEKFEKVSNFLLFPHKTFEKTQKLSI